MTLALTPTDCLRRRFEAHRRGDYAAIYASYHADAPFRQQFQHLDDYEDFAREHLAAIEMKSWQCTMQRRLDEQQVECIHIIEFGCEGSLTYLVELALLINNGQGWYYHSAQKLDAQELSVPAVLVDFRHFDQAQVKVRF